MATSVAAMLFVAAMVALIWAIFGAMLGAAIADRSFLWTGQMTTPTTIGLIVGAVCGFVPGSIVGTLAGCPPRIERLKQLAAEPVRPSEPIASAQPKAAA